MTSLATQFQTRVVKRIRQTSYVRTLNALEAVCNDIVANFMQNKEFYNVTGNAFTSFTVGLYYKKHLVYTTSPLELGASNPTRKTLKKGEHYNLPEYYEGDSVGEKAYVGEYGGGGQWGPAVGERKIRSARPSGRGTWHIVAVCPIQYAKYNRKIYDTMEQTCQNMPSLVTANIVEFRDPSF